MTDFSKPNSLQNKSIIVGIGGGSGSGKTFFAKALQQRLGDTLSEIIYQDNFYIDQSHRFDKDGGAVNFDHPSSIDFDLLTDCLLQLKTGTPTEIPIYDFKTHKRQEEKIKITVKPIIIVDGILIFHPRNLRETFNELIFFDTPEELRFQRRLERDVKERGRTPDGVREQFFKQVKPMHDQFVAPSMQFAHQVVKDVSGFDEVLESFHTKLRGLI